MKGFINTFKQTFCVLLLFTGSNTLMAQQPEPWINNEYPPVRGGNYEYRVASGTTEDAALQQFYMDLCREGGVLVEAKTTGHRFIDQVDAKNERDQQFTGFTFGCQGDTVWCYRVRQQTINGMVYLLYEVSKKGDFKPYYPVYKQVENYKKPTSVALSFVPFGAAQFYKGNKGFGTFFLTSEAVALVGAGMAWYRSNNYYDDYLKERNPNQRAEYQRLSQNAETLCYISLGVAGGLYACQIMHGIFADGKRKKYDLAMIPYFTPNNMGFALLFNF